MNEPARKIESCTGKARLVGINHVAIEVDDVEEALEFYGSIFEFTLRGRGEGMAFIDMGDQFIAIEEKRTQKPDRHRHFGLVVDDREAVRRQLEELNVEPLPGGFLDFLDPWGNRIQIVEYRGIQFTKAPYVLRGMGLEGLEKTPEAIGQLEAKGMSPGKKG
jgi:catechol 2,3-dioxygenase-like lactoylglutathione lyase family enzyme